MIVDKRIVRLAKCVVLRDLYKAISLYHLRKFRLREFFFFLIKSLEMYRDAMRQKLEMMEDNHG